jgi:hypothetical protein
MNIHLRKILALVAAGIVVGEELENPDHRKHDFYHVELRGYEVKPGPTAQISASGGGGVNFGAVATTLPRLRVNALGIFEDQQ